MKAYWANRKAQEAESVIAAEAAVIEQVPEVVSNERPVRQQTKAVQARWAGETASEEELRDLFTKISLDKAMSLHDRMRKNLEIAGKILNERTNVPEVQRCKTCKITWQKFLETARRTDWFLNRPHYHPSDRNIIVVDHFCSAACVSLENNKTQGVRGISDHGMLPSDNPQNHLGIDVKSLHDKAI